MTQKAITIKDLAEKDKLTHKTKYLCIYSVTGAER